VRFVQNGEIKTDFRLSRCCGKRGTALIRCKNYLWRWWARAQKYCYFFLIGACRKAKVINFAIEVISLQFADRFVTANAEPIRHSVMGEKLAGPICNTLADQCEAGNMRLALRASASQNAVRLLPVPHGIISRPRVSPCWMKCFVAAAIAAFWWGLGSLGFGLVLRRFILSRIWPQVSRSIDWKRSKPTSTVWRIKWRLPTGLLEVWATTPKPILLHVLKARLVKVANSRRRHQRWWCRHARYCVAWKPLFLPQCVCRRMGYRAERVEPAKGGRGKAR